MSRRRSASSSEFAKQLERVEFFVDRSFGAERVAQALRARGAVVHAHGDYFEDDTPDAIWLAEAATKSWVVLLRDRQVLKNDLEMQAIVSFGARAFIFKRANMKMDEVAGIMASYLPTMRKWAVKRPAPFIGIITGSGLQQIYPRRAR